MTLEEYFGDWLRVIDKDELFTVTKKINQLYKTSQCEPEYSNIFKVFNITPYNKLHQVWLLQDPYPQKGVATGIALANKSDKAVLSPSLEVLRESVIDYETFHPFRTFVPTLENWCKQGVLLLNTALTVETNKPGSHTAIWREFIKKLLCNLAERNPGLIYVLWGTSASSFKMYVDKYGIVKTMPHPAFLARTHSKLPSTFFVDLNKLSKHHFDTEVQWYN